VTDETASPVMAVAMEMINPLRAVADGDSQPVPEAEESGGVARKWDEVKDATKKAFAFF
jgi:hypothetical protein